MTFLRLGGVLRFEMGTSQDFTLPTRVLYGHAGKGAPRWRIMKFGCEKTIFVKSRGVQTHLREFRVTATRAAGRGTVPDAPG